MSAFVHFHLAPEYSMSNLLFCRQRSTNRSDLINQGRRRARHPRTSTLPASPARGPAAPPRHPPDDSHGLTYLTNPITTHQWCNTPFELPRHPIVTTLRIQRSTMSKEDVRGAKTDHDGCRGSGDDDHRR